jgi:hypothetical protein
MNRGRLRTNCRTWPATGPGAVASVGDAYCRNDQLLPRPRLDLICIPGARTGVVQAMGDRETTEFVQLQSSPAKYLHSRFRWITQGTPRNDALGLYRAATADRR